MDLFLWSGDRGELLGFQLSYDKAHGEHALAWSAQAGFTHDRVDDGEAMPGARYKASPMLRQGGMPDVDRIARLLAQAGQCLAADLLDALLAKISQCAHPESGDTPA